MQVLVFFRQELMLLLELELLSPELDSLLELELLAVLDPRLVLVLLAGLVG